MKYTRLAAEGILPFFYPVRCPVCQDIVIPKGRLVCPSCADRPKYIEDPVCMKCGRQIREGEELCGNCKAHDRSFERGFSLMRYDGIGQESIRNFKENGRQEYAAWYAEELIKRRGDELRALRADLLVPVPLHPKRLRIRGYNQALLLAREISRRTKIPVRDDLLRRVSDTLPMKNMSPGERQNNLKKAFQCYGNDVELNSIMLIDDIYTTGSTIDACAQALYRKGAGHVYFMTLAIGEDYGC